MTLDDLKAEWPGTERVLLLSDGASNFTCTALMTSMPRLFAAMQLRLAVHVISEVGDGKNLTDTDFQQVQRSLEAMKNSGGSV